MPKPPGRRERESRERAWMTRVGVLKFLTNVLGERSHGNARVCPKAYRRTPTRGTRVPRWCRTCWSGRRPRVADQGFEPIGMTGHPVDHESTVGPSRRSDSRRVEEWVCLEGVVEPQHQVLVDPTRPVLTDLVGEFLAVTRSSLEG